MESYFEHPGLRQLTLQLVREGRVWDLSHELRIGMPVHPQHPPYVFTLVRRHGDSHREEGYSAANDLLLLSGHHGTHIDALGHVSIQGRLQGGIDADEAQRGGTGLREKDAAAIRPFLDRGLLIDVPALLGVGELEAGYEISVRDVEQALSSYGELQVKPGDAVLFRTGWGRRWQDPERFYPKDGCQPGPGEAVSHWLSEHEVVVTGSDTMVFECVRPGQNRMPVHAHLLAGIGIHIIEMLALEELAAADIHEFLFIGMPLRICGGTGAPFRALAIA